MSELRYTIEMHRPPYGTASVRILTTMRIVRRFHGSIPTVEVLRSEFGKSRATAYRWVAAFKHEAERGA